MYIILCSVFNNNRSTALKSLYVYRTKYCLIYRLNFEKMRCKPLHVKIMTFITIAYFNASPLNFASMISSVYIIVTFVWDGAYYWTILFILTVFYDSTHIMYNMKSEFCVLSIFLIFCFQIHLLFKILQFMHFAVNNFD